MSSPLAQNGVGHSTPPFLLANATDRADGIAEKIETFFENVNLWASDFREKTIQKQLEDYLNRIGAGPTAGEVHIFYVQAFTNDQGVVSLNDFQYLTHGKTSAAALRESFTLEHAPGTEARLVGVPNGMRLVGI
jgi:hypothetical protein